MTNIERFDLFNGSEFQIKIQIELVDWLAYWTTAGIDGIGNDLLKRQTGEAIRLMMTDLSTMTRKVALLALGEGVIKDAVTPTDANIKTAVTTIMTNKLRWLTGVSE